MPRPPKCRRVGFIPQMTYFKPAGVPIHLTDEVCLSIEEVEAIRLKDLEGLDQEESAEKMRVSRPTFQRVLGSARQRIADALLNGKAIRIEGGNFEMATLRFKCRGEGHEWDVPVESMVAGPPDSCPSCRSSSVYPAPGHGWGERGRCRRGRGNQDGQ